MPSSKSDAAPVNELGPFEAGYGAPTTSRLTDFFVTVVIVNYNSGDKLAKCLEHLSAQTFRDFETVIIDNASIDDSLKLASDVELPVRVIKSDENLGFAAGNNRAVETARGEWLAFLNPDAYATPDWLACFVSGVESYPWADAFGSMQLDAADDQRLDGAGDVCSAYGFAYRSDFGRSASYVRGDVECFAPCAAAAFYRRSRFVELGGFDERFFCYAEDVDLGFRLRLSGGRCVQLSQAVVRHEGSAITGRYSSFSIYHGHRNRIWLYYKNTPLLLYILTAPLRLLADLAFGVQSIFQRQSSAYFRALRDGYGGLSKLDHDRKRWAQRGKSHSVMAMFVWSPVRVLARGGKARPVEPTNRE